MRVLQERFVLEEALVSERLTPPIARGLELGLSPAVVLKRTAAPSPPSPTNETVAVLEGGILYFSGKFLCDYQLADLLSSEIRRWKPIGDLPAILIDLRGVHCHEQWAEVARVTSFFIEPGLEIFAMKSRLGELEVFSTLETGSSPLTQPVALIVDESTSGVPELLAIVLSKYSRATVFGKPTAGALYRYFPYKIDAEHTLLIADALIVFVADADRPLGRVAPDWPREGDPRQAAEDYLRAARVLTPSVLASESR